MIQYFTSLNPAAFGNALPGNVAQGLIWGIMALGVYITFRLLDFADLTVDGSFATGGAVTVMMTITGHNIWISLLCASLAGLLAGLCTGLLHTKLGIPPILAGILTQIALYSVNLNIMDRHANQALSIDKYTLILSSRNLTKAIIVGLLFSVVLIALLYWYFGTEQGSAIRATGCNPAMSKAQGINIDNMKLIGLALSNAIVPNVSAAYALGKKDDMNDSIQMAIRFTMMIAIPCAVGLGVLNSSINGLIFGAVYAKGLGAAMLRIGAVSVIFYCLSTLTNGILQGMGKMRVPVKHSAISVVVNIVVLWLLLTYTDCKTYGLVFATMAFSLVMCLLNAHSIKKYTGFHQEITKTFIKPALSAAVMGVVCFLIQYGVQSVLPFGRVCFAICVIIAVPVGALIYFAAIIKLKVFTEEELTKIPKGNLIVKLAKKLHLL